MKKSLMLLLLILLQPVQAATVWVEKDSHHTALIVAREDLQQHAPALAALNDASIWLRFGWGDRDYYGASKHKPGDALKALLLPTDSVVEVTPMKALHGDEVELRAVTVNDKQLRKLLARISRTLYHDGKGRVRLERREAGGRDYYRSDLTYHLLWNCNTWTAKLLGEADLRIPYGSSIFSGSLLRRLDKALNH